MTPALWTRDPELIAKPYVTLADLHERRIVTMGRYNYIRQGLLESCKTRGVIPDIHIETNSTPLAINVALQTDASILGLITEKGNPFADDFVSRKLIFDGADDFGFFIFRRKNNLYSKPVREAWDKLLEMKGMLDHAIL